MSKSLSKKQKYIIAGFTAVWGLVFIGSGVSMSLMNTPVTKTKNELKVTQKRVANMKSNEIRLKSMEQEINQPISMNIKDYLENVNDIDEKIINELQLDTSMVNVNQAGNYTYTITYKKKTFNGSFTIKEKPLPDMVLTLKSLNLEVGSALSTDIQNYIAETLTEEVKQNIEYMYDEYFFNAELEYPYQVINDREDINNILKLYIEKYYNENDDKQTWFDRIKELAGELGYAKEVKEYKANPDAYKAHVGDVSTVIRVALTGRTNTPDMYEIMQVLGKESVIKRLESAIK